MRFPDRPWLAVLFFSFNLGSLIAAGIFQLVPPLSAAGQFLFWPQNILPFLHLHPDSSAGGRIMFLLLVAALGASIDVLMSLRAMKTISMSLVRIGSGIIAILAPMLGWLLIGPRGSIPSALLWISTLAWTFYVAYCVWKRRGIRSWELALIAVFYFGFWVYLFHTRIDPVMLAIPLLAGFSYLLWAPGQHSRAAVAGG